MKLRIGAAVCAALVALAGLAVPASAAPPFVPPPPPPCGSPYWPAEGVVAATPQWIRVSFRFTQADIGRLRCYSQWAEVNLAVYGVPAGAAVTAFNTNLPGAVQDVPWQPRLLYPGATMILTRDLAAGTLYFVEAQWSQPGTQFTANFAPIRRAYPQSVIEKNCTQPPPACMFAVTNGWHDMVGGARALGGTYPVV